MEQSDCTFFELVEENVHVCAAVSPVMILKVKNLQNVTHTVYLRDYHTVHTIKEQLQDLTGDPAALIKVIMSGKILTSDQRISSLNIKPESFAVFLTGRLTSGGNKLFDPTEHF